MELFTHLDDQQEELILGGQGRGILYIAINNGNVSNGILKTIDFNRERLRDLLQKKFERKDLRSLFRQWLWC